MEQTIREKVNFKEELSSKKTTLFFGFLSLSSAGLFFLLKSAGYSGLLMYIFLALCIVFLFYVLNYYRLRIFLQDNQLKLGFGIFKMSIDLNNISEVCLDQIPPINRYGGAGIHFMMVDGVYRASLNFLEYPRVLIVLRKKKGLVQAVSFSTKFPEKWIQIIGSCTSR